MLLALVVVLVCGIEVGTRTVILRMSQTERQVTNDYRDALGARRSASQPSVLLVGNSLLVEDVRFDSLRASLAPEIRAHRLAVVETMFYDWYYGLRTLFARGAEPDLVALVVARPHVTSSFFRGSYSAFRLVSAGDLLDLSRDLDLHPTVTTGYLLANVSAFYGLRTEVRAQILKLVIPQMEALGPVFGRNAAFVETRTVDPENEFASARDRLRRLHALTASQHARLVLVFPPMGRERAAATTLPGDPVVRAAAAAGVPVIQTSSPQSYLESVFRDGLHMNETGATLYTAELASALRRALTSHDSR